MPVGFSQGSINQTWHNDAYILCQTITQTYFDFLLKKYMILTLECMLQNKYMLLEHIIITIEKAVNPLSHTSFLVPRNLLDPLDQI